MKAISMRVRRTLAGSRTKRNFLPRLDGPFIARYARPSVRRRSGKRFLRTFSTTVVMDPKNFGCPP